MTLSDADRAAIEARHVSTRWVTHNMGQRRERQRCSQCLTLWPCDTARLLVALSDAEAERDAARADAERLAEALDECHRRCESFQPGGRGQMFPGAYALDHPPRGNDDGCTFCAAIALHRERRPAEEGG